MSRQRPLGRWNQGRSPAPRRILCHMEVSAVTATGHREKGASTYLPANLPTSPLPPSHTGKGEQEETPASPLSGALPGPLNKDLHFWMHCVIRGACVPHSPPTSRWQGPRPGTQPGAPQAPLKYSSAIKQAEMELSTARMQLLQI